MGSDLRAQEWGIEKSEWGMRTGQSKDEFSGWSLLWQRGLRPAGSLRGAHGMGLRIIPRSKRTAFIKQLPCPIVAKLSFSPVGVPGGPALVTEEPWGRMVTGASDRCCQMPPGQGWCCSLGWVRAEGT